MRFSDVVEEGAPVRCCSSRECSAEAEISPPQVCATVRKEMRLGKLIVDPGSRSLEGGKVRFTPRAGLMNRESLLALGRLQCWQASGVPDRGGVHSTPLLCLH
ncbi:hypothetical protein PUN28_017992 [Cardiocondyla obscurior]|uniref:Uncharacterized protein n=1 Tax=Cardiocondyla obscurior TaxID=286306 RepID=A0AAW2EJI5_9HYME